MKQGELHSIQFYEDEPWVLAVGGSKGEVAIWDTEESELIRNHFATEAKPYLTKDFKPGQVTEDDGNSDFEDMSDDSEEVKKPTKKSKKTKK